MILFTSITKNPSELSSKGDIELMRDSISYIRTKYKSKSWESTQVVLRIEKLISIALQIQETNTAATNDKKPNSTGKSKSEEPSVSTGNIPDDLQSFNLARNPSGQLDLLRIETLPKLQPSEWFSLSGNTPSTAAFSPWPFSNDDLCFINPEKAVDSSSMKYTPNLFMDDLKQYHISSILKSDPFYGL
ncbi:hypothetical protein NEOLI_001978 [Neolecta irregularis DAH-3]|uniref:Uncharacterized protein n=1 Tax=Neolecta irregularis (strain DAH-3) TaxID=1198029 RepID=A0A1U7LWG2_NEOID|nr:hypothetical protein NEOLI_001978 [Neolecta irregularis DAH-3]|eukprot:OLL26974.1 hypothetical protein NEOLI_001978 [Neolecta irregularis DAH-3]